MSLLYIYKAPAKYSFRTVREAQRASLKQLNMYTHLSIYLFIYLRLSIYLSNNLSIYRYIHIVPVNESFRTVGEAQRASPTAAI